MGKSNDKIAEGVRKTQDFLKSTVVTHTQDGISVTLTAEPEILEISIEELAPRPVDLSKKLVKCINEAVSRVKEKIAQKVYENL